MARPRNNFVDLLQYLGIRTAAMIFHSFPVETNLRTARWLGAMWFRFLPTHRQRTLINIQRAYPEWSDGQHRALARESMQNLCVFGMEMLFTTRLIRLDTWAKHCELQNFREALQLMMEPNRPAIMVTGHYGNWEVLGYAMATLGFETASVFRPLDNPYLNQWVLGVREKQGQRMLVKKGATSEATDILEAGGSVGFIADQNAGPKGLFVDFFGRKASTHKSISLLAIRYNTPIVVGYSRRASDGRFHFTMIVQEIIWPESWADQADPMMYITQRFTRAIEDFVREVPGQYLWTHRRWKTRPKGEVN